MPLSFSSRSSIEDLWARFDAEAGHARQVAGLALQLFDATRAYFGIPEGDRDPLEAACLLHDVGYASDHRGHAEAGSRIVLRHGIEGFPRESLRVVAALIRLHPASLSLDAAKPKSARLPESRRVLYAAAILRIADALDYAHLQDASIVSVRVMKRKIQVAVRGGELPACVAMAQRQSAMWREVFPVDVEFRALVSATTHPLLTPSLTVHEGIRRLLFLHYRVVLANVDGALEGTNDEALHDLRIGLRRFRTVLRAFRRPLSHTSAKRIDRDFQQLNRILGIARDLDVWIGFFSKESVSAQFTRHRLWPKFIAHQIELRRLQQATVRRQLHGAHFAALQLRIGRFLRVELPAEAAASPPVPLARPARRALARSLHRALELGNLRQSRSPDKLHRLRIALRRLRYLGGFFAPVLGRPVRKLSRRTHTLERMLGQMRDADLVLSRILQEGPVPPRLLVRQLERLRRADAAAMEAAWGRFEDPQFILSVRRDLKR